MYKLIAFDYDGTLADTFDFHVKSIGHILRSCGSRVDDREVGELIGKTLKYIFDKTLPCEKHALAVETMEKFYGDIPTEYWEYVKLFDGVEKTLSGLKQRGLKLALVTNSHRKLIEASLCHVKIYSYFDFIEAADEDSYNKEQRIEKVIQRSKIEKNKILYVGDTSGDVKDAQKSGIKACLVNNKSSWIHREKTNIFDLRPDLTISSIKELLEIIKINGS
ncbi:MAG: HAD family hydrolase [Eubacterium sp.]|nr:HAD family hydrolase [Eubacterium sp.]